MNHFERSGRDRRFVVVEPNFVIAKDLVQHRRPGAPVINDRRNGARLVPSQLEVGLSARFFAVDNPRAPAVASAEFGRDVAVDRGESRVRSAVFVRRPNLRVKRKVPKRNTLRRRRTVRRERDRDAAESDATTERRRPNRSFHFSSLLSRQNPRSPTFRFRSARDA